MRKKFEKIEIGAVATEPFFTNKKGEILPLSAIKERKVTLIKVEYLTKRYKELPAGIRKIFGPIEIKQTIESVDFLDQQNGINILTNDSIGLMVIRLRDQESLKKLNSKKSHDPDTLWKHEIPGGLFRAGFHINNVKNIDWE